MASRLPDWPGSIDTSPRLRIDDRFAWADFVELLCLARPDGMVTRSDVVDWMRLNVEDLGEAEVMEDLAGVDGTERAGQADDKWQELTKQWFEHLEYRANAFGATYPFVFHKPESEFEGGPSLHRRTSNRDDISYLQRLYLALLFASNLRYCKQAQSKLTRGFERLGFWTLKGLMGPNAIVRIFGSGPPPSHYSGNTFSKLQRLAEDVRADLWTQEDEWHPNSSGDAGIDLVAWFPFEDVAPTMLVVFAQCAATEAWVTKQFSSSASRWSPHFRFFARPVNFVFLPHCFRNAEGKLHSTKDIGETVIVDRLRLIKVLEQFPGDVMSESVLDDAADLASLTVGEFE